MPPGKIALEEHVVLPALSAPGAAGSSADVNDVDYFAERWRGAMVGQGPSSMARWTSSLKRCFASCTCQLTAVPPPKCGKR